VRSCSADWRSRRSGLPRGRGGLVDSDGSFRALRSGATVLAHLRIKLR
jgi:hypothetical protein